MMVALVLGAVQTALVAALLAERSRRRRAERALATSEAARRSSDREAQTLAGRLILSQESERQRIARDLHDNLSQKLAALCIELTRLGNGASASAAVAGAVARLSERARDIADDVRRLAHDLHPPNLELLGLAPAIKSLCLDMSRIHNLQITFRSEAVSRRVPADVALCLFRISQEALQNVVKHSDTTAATVRLRTTRTGIRLHIADGGKGFCETSNDGSGLGLRSMRERVRFARGRIAIRSTADHGGAHIVVNLPIDHDGSGADHGPTRLRFGRDADAVLAGQGPPDRPEREKSIRMRAKQLATTAVAVAILMNAALAGAQAPAAEGINDADGWKTIVYPIHAWLPVLGADVRLPGQPTPPGSGGSGGITIPSAKTSGNFNGAALAGFRVERARLSIEGEFLWAGMSGGVDAPRFAVDVDTISGRLIGGFEVAPALYIDAGVRRLALDITASILNFQPVGWKPTIWEPIIGTTFRPHLSKRLRLFTQAGVGFSTDDSSRSGSVTASVEWKPISASDTRRRLGLDLSQDRRRHSKQGHPYLADAERPDLHGRHGVLKATVRESIETSTTVKHRRWRSQYDMRFHSTVFARWAITFGVLAALALVVPTHAAAQQAAPSKPNIVVIWGDDIGYWNISAYNHGMMGYKTPNIDRIAKEGALFTDWYGQQSCTAGRAAFITGQNGFRTGLLKVGLPGAKEGLQARDVTIAQLLKAQGYATAQFGKNHLGDLDEHLPTAHGFDEFFGSLYHLNAEEEFENPDYFKDPALIKRYQTRGVIHTWANADGTQRIESAGPLGKKRMETIDEEITKASLDYLDKAKQAGKPFFLWWNSTRMHVNTHLKPESVGKTGLGVYPDGMVEHDAMVGQLLDKLKALGLEENTIVMYSTDNGAEAFSWPDGGTTPFRGEKATNWEGGYRVPTAIRWPGVIKPGTVNNQVFSHEDMLPTLVAAAGVPDVKEQLLKGMKVGDKTFKVHLDGYNVTDALAGKAASPRHEFFYFSDDGSLVGLRYDNWKIVFAEQRSEGLDVWQEPFVPLRLPKIFNLRADPFEMADRSGIGYAHWRVDRTFLLVPAQQYIGQFLATFKEFPPSQKVGSFSLDQVLETLQKSGGG